MVMSLWPRFWPTLYIQQNWKVLEETYDENSWFQKLLQSTVVPGIIPAFRNK